MSAGFFDHETVNPFSILGLHGQFWQINVDTVVATWIAMGIMLILALVGKHFLKKEFNLVAAGYETVVSIFVNLCKDSFPHFNYYYFAFASTLFFFTFMTSVVGIIPYVEEATRDLNTTFAIAFSSFAYVQYQKIRVHGILGFLKEFIEPLFILAPIHIIGELSKIVSMSFRLFGNILGGNIMLVMAIKVLEKHEMGFLIAVYSILISSVLIYVFVPTTKFQLIRTINKTLMNIIFLVAWIQMFFGVFEGMIQAFVLTMLTITYLAIGTQEHHSTN